MEAILTPETEARFWPKVGRGGPDDCWEWLAGKDGDGYGYFSVNKRNVKATWVIWYLTHGVWPAAGMDLHHRCLWRACVNPAHLSPVTRRVNLCHRRFRSQERLQRDLEALYGDSERMIALLSRRHSGWLRAEAETREMAPDELLERILDAFIARLRAR